MKVLDIKRGDQRIAWTMTWIVDNYDTHRLVAIPRLRLSQELALELTARAPYARVFREAVMQVLEDPPRPFVVVHATFDLYRTGEPDLIDFAVLVPDPEVPLPPPASVITKTAKMLKGETR